MVFKGGFTSDTIDAWSASRSGAWAGRGFHYQHFVSTLILIRQWAGYTPSGYVIPEGLEDSVIEAGGQEFWLQIKSRKDGTFSRNKVESVLAEVEAKAVASKSQTAIRCAVVLEQSCAGMAEVDIGQLSEESSYQVFVCSFPGEESVALITDKLGVAKIIAEGLVSDLYRLVAEASQANASLPFERRRKISTTEVERRIFERLEAEDPSAIERALAEGMLEPVDFTDSLSEPAFYQGVKAKPGHVAAGLVIQRPGDTQVVVDALKKNRQILLSGPSGAGKSALLWLSVNSLAGEICWYQVTYRAGVADAAAIISFVRARRPSEKLPLGLVMDELGTANSDLWDVLTRELKGYPFVYFIGSIRQEDVVLVTNQVDTEIISVNLDENLAEGVWRKLRSDNETSWEHWREPFEQAEGLMLEYVHLLTQGKRLSAVVEEQVRLRRLAKRDDELAIIRGASLLFTYGAEVRTKELCTVLHIDPADASRALARLIDEHLIRESRPGVLGGLHALRSHALSKASHDEAVYLADDSLWKGLAAVTHETMPGVIQSLLRACSAEQEATVLQKLAGILADNLDVDDWVSILTGLGLATLERYVVIFIEILGQHGVQRGQWSLASMFGCDAQIDIPDLSEFEHWQTLRNAILAFRALSKPDLRNACMDYLPESSAIPASQNLEQANRLFSCLVPICGGEPIQVKVTPDVVDDEEHDIRQVASLLSTAYLIEPTLAEQLAQALGGEQVLYDWFRAQTPWVESPVVDSEGEHGRTVRSDWYHVAEQEQSEPHETVCSICETLIALSPGADAAAADALNPLGQPIVVCGYRPWSKNMPRQNIAAKTRVAWNVAFRQIMFARSVSISLTEYTQQMAGLVTRTEKTLRSFTEKWIRGKRIGNADALAVEINNINHQVNALTYAIPTKPAPVMVLPAKGGDGDDSLGALLTGILGNLVRRLGKIPSDENAKGAAMFAGSLAAQAHGQRQSDIWRTHPAPPLRELKTIEERLNDLACILHEMAYDSGNTSIEGIVKSARKGAPGKAITAAARRCSILAEQRLNRHFQTLERKLKSKGWNAKCWVRSLDEPDSVHWPAKDVAITVEIEDLETDATYIEDSLDLGQQYFGDAWRFRVVPVINGIVLAPLALAPSLPVPLPDLSFSDEWKKSITHPFFNSETVAAFDDALAACIQLSGIMACRDLDNLHPDENRVFSKAIEVFKSSRVVVTNVAEEVDSEYVEWACDRLDQAWNQIVEEFDERKAGRIVKEPLCMGPYLAIAGEANDQSIEIGLMRMLMLQDECVRAANN
ncbi:hypothetical protein KV699_04700 [Vreelandella titanicae]|uniref:hypothetical protein n=1 Tax=Halomonadaceae TaxID=28256 RepID=UPI00047F41EE|nr:MULTISPECIES: hypothetical protein [unclassified Halomonas]PKH58572.1 hypothetical protein CXF94_21500 [Halomonas sp. Choline-3u-9]QGQ69463.1 hypothetical protein FDY98_03840 [Halomonas sp. PA16-9]